jgi:MFS family permease
MTFISVPAMLGPLTGPPLAGFLVTYADWRWIFVINIPVAIIGIVLATLYFSNEREEPVPLDVKGFLLSSIALPGIVLGAALAGRHLSSPWAAIIAFTIGIGASILYVRHARTVPRPLLDLRLFSYPTFDAGVVGGTLFRFGIGASAFLMPLMLQLGFGYDAMTSGLVTFAGALGALSMKSIAPFLLRRFGFRPILIWNGVLTVAMIVATSFFTPATPHLVMSTVLLAGGFVRALQFSSLNAIAYADIPPERSSAATSLASVAQQVSISLGVAIAAVALEISSAFAGRTTLAPQDFSFALLVVATLSALSIVRLMRLAPDAGSALSGGDAIAKVVTRTHPAE